MEFFGNKMAGIVDALVLLVGVVLVEKVKTAEVALGWKVSRRVVVLVELAVRADVALDFFMRMSALLSTTATTPWLTARPN